MVQLHMIYQCAFAVITPALISGTIVGRMKFTSYMIFVFVWVSIVYCPLAHAVSYCVATLSLSESKYLPLSVLS